MRQTHPKRLILAISTVVASLGGANVPATRAAPGDIFNLGTLGGTFSEGWGINDAGQVARDSTTTEDASSAIIAPMTNRDARI